MLEDPDFYTDCDDKCFSVYRELSTKSLTNVTVTLLLSIILNICFIFLVYVIVNILKISNVVFLNVISISSTLVCIFVMRIWYNVFRYRDRFIKRVKNISFSATYVAEIKHLAVVMDYEFNTTQAQYWVSIYV